MEYGKSKGIIEEGAVPNMAVPEGGKSYEKMLAHSAADKISAGIACKLFLKNHINGYTLKAFLSGVKYLGPDYVDVIFNMPDYPTSPAEFLTFS